MVQSFEEFLKCLNDQLMSSPIDLRDFAPRVAVALLWQQLQVARTIAVAVINGYGGETLLLTRPILSAAGNVIYIAKSDSAIPAWWYQLDLEETEASRITRVEQHGMVTQAEAQIARQTKTPNGRKLTPKPKLSICLVRRR